jgi:diguanylate cyclase (GGDEF)-like protein/PAS domain S-box-containing protein
MTTSSLPVPLVEHDSFQLMIEAICDYAVYMLDCTGHVVTWNRGAELSKGYTSAEILGKHFKILFTPEDSLAGEAEKELDIAREAGRFSAEGWRLHKNGSRFWASVVLTAIRDPQGELLGFVKVLRDLTDRKRQEDALLAMDAALREERDRLQEERDRFLAAAESSLDSIYICKAVRNQDGEIEDFLFTYLNSNVETMVSIPRPRMLGCRMCEVLPVNRSSGLFDRYKQVVLTGEPLVLELPINDHDVKCAWIRVQAVKLHDGVAITASDVTGRKSDEARILHLAHHDALTGLPNRSIMDDRVGQAIKSARRRDCRMAVLLIDLDNFKQINDSLGHQAGDEVLCGVATRLRAALRESDTVIRIGGDEFVIVVPELIKKDDIHHLEKKISAHIGEPMLIGDQSLQVTCSIGSALYPDDAEDADALISHADTAMYAAKRGGSGRSFATG